MCEGFLRIQKHALRVKTSDSWENYRSWSQHSPPGLCLGELQKLIPTFSTRTMRCEFIERYNRVDHLKPAIIHDMWRILTKDSTAAETSAEAEVDVRVIEVLLAADDSQLTTMDDTRTWPTIHFGMNSNASLTNSQL